MLAVQRRHCACLIWRLRLTGKKSLAMFFPRGSLLSKSHKSLKQLHQNFASILPELRPLQKPNKDRAFSIRLAAVCVALPSDFNFFMLNLFMPQPGPAAQTCFREWSNSHLFLCLSISTLSLVVTSPAYKSICTWVSETLQSEYTLTQARVISILFFGQECHHFSFKM